MMSVFSFYMFIYLFIYIKVLKIWKSRKKKTNTYILSSN